MQGLQNLGWAVSLEELKDPLNAAYLELSIGIEKEAMDAAQAYADMERAKEEILASVNDAKNLSSFLHKAEAVLLHNGRFNLDKNPGKCHLLMINLIDVVSMHVKLSKCIEEIQYKPVYEIMQLTEEDFDEDGENEAIHSDLDDDTDDDIYGNSSDDEN